MLLSIAEKFEERRVEVDKLNDPAVKGSKYEIETALRSREDLEETKNVRDARDDSLVKEIVSLNHGCRSRNLH